jgi:hypothetical protein
VVFNKPQSPLEKATLVQLILADLRLRPYTHHIRIYSALENSEVTPLASSLGLPFKISLLVRGYVVSKIK